MLRSFQQSCSGGMLASSPSSSLLFIPQGHCDPAGALTIAALSLCLSSACLLPPSFTADSAADYVSFSPVVCYMTIHTSMLKPVVSSSFTASLFIPSLNFPASLPSSLHRTLCISTYLSPVISMFSLRPLWTM